MINLLGTDPLPRLFAIKAKTTAFLNKIPFLVKDLPDRFLQLLSNVTPKVLPKKMRLYRKRFVHHLILEMSDDGIAEAEHFLHKFVSNYADVDFFECSEMEAKKAKLHRFAAAGAPVRYEICNANKVESIVALDIALRRNDVDWFEELPESINQHVEHALYYGHFMCHVMHQDYIIKKGADVKKIKKQMLSLLESRGAKYPAEHNVGHLYEAESQLKSFYSELDPTNTFNPGIGGTSKKCGCH